MSTRGLLGVVVDGEFKGTYNHYDSYPSGLGCDVVKAVDTIIESADAFATAYNQAAALLVVDGDSPVTSEWAERLVKSTDTRVGRVFGADGSSDEGLNWYQATRGLQGDLLATLRAGVMVDCGGWPLDSLFCEWGYVLDLDRRCLDVYRGFQTRRHEDGRWAGLPSDEQIAETAAEAQRRYEAGEITERQRDYFARTEYHSIRLVRSLSFEACTAEAMGEIEEECYRDEGADESETVGA